MYATSSEHTRVPWAAHTYNVAFSDEIGHFNYCDAQDGPFIPGLLGACLSSPVENEVDATGAHNEVDDFLCLDPASSLIFGSLGPLGGCLDSDVDFDGVPYHNAWAGTGPDPYGSPKFRPNEDEGEERDGNLQSFKCVAFHR
jgi:hypothetical protein